MISRIRVHSNRCENLGANRQVYDNMYIGSVFSFDERCEKFSITNSKHFSHCIRVPQSRYFVCPIRINQIDIGMNVMLYTWTICSTVSEISISIIHGSEAINALWFCRQLLETKFIVWLSVSSITPCHRQVPHIRNARVPEHIVVDISEKQRACSDLTYHNMISFVRHHSSLMVSVINE